MGPLPEAYEIGTVALPAYILLYRNPRTTGKWYIHRGYSQEALALETAVSFKSVGFDTLVIPLTYDDKELKILNAF